MANEVSEYDKANYEDLPKHVKRAYGEAQKALQYAKEVHKENPSKYKIAENSILVGLCKIIYGDQ